MYKLTTYGKVDSPILETRVFKTLEEAQNELFDLRGIKFEEDEIISKQYEENGIDYYLETDDNDVIHISDKGMKASVKIYGNHDIDIVLEISKIENPNILRHESGEHYLNIDGHQDYVKGITKEELTEYIWENQTDAYSQDIAEHIEGVWEKVNER